jgi:hypothetical protein
MSSLKEIDASLKDPNKMMKLFFENNAEVTLFNMAIQGCTYYAKNPKKRSKYERTMANVTHIESRDNDEGDGEDYDEKPPGNRKEKHVESSDNDEGDGDDDEGDGDDDDMETTTMKYQEMEIKNMWSKVTTIVRNIMVDCYFLEISMC